MSMLLTAVAWVSFLALAFGLILVVRRGALLTTCALLLCEVALFFKAIFPGFRIGTGEDAWVGTGIAMLATGRDLPLPVPSAAFAMYMAATTVGLLIAVSSNDTWLTHATRPIISFLRGDRGSSRLRLGVLYGILPLGVASIVLSGYVPRAAAPVESRQAHPSISYDADAVNPFRDGTQVDPEAVKTGRELFAKNCRPCHGMRADGVGPMARGFRLRPANFHDPGTIATLVEPYAKQRVMDGGVGLPPNGSPWDSAMPRWKDDLTEEEIWMILLAEYEISGVNPRIPEGE